MPQNFNNMDKILITGFAGFVGHHFLNYMEENHIECQVLGLDVTSNLMSDNYTYIRLSTKTVDLLDYESLEKVVTEFSPDYILHLASYSSVAFSWENPTISFRNNVNIFLNILEIIRNNHLKTRILSIGSSEEYGKVASNDIPLKESTQLNPLSPYAVARVSQEMLSRLYASAFGIDIVITRSFNHIGPYQRDTFVVSSFVKKILELKRSNKNAITLYTGDTSIIRDFLDVRDVVHAYYLLLKNGKSGEIYNVCSGNGISLKEVVVKISHLVDVRIMTHIDSNLIRPQDNPLIIGDNAKLIKDTGWMQRYSLEQSLMDIIDWWNKKLS